MELTLIGHEDRYAVEQLLLSLFGAGADLAVQSRLFRGKTWLTAATRLTLNGNTATAYKRLAVNAETVPTRRQTLQQSAYRAALQLLDSAPAWGALAGVRPTKISTKHLLEGGTEKSAKKLLEKVYYVTPQRAMLAARCSQATVNAAKLCRSNDISLYIGIPFCPTRCSYCSFVSSTVGKKTELIEPYLQALFQEIAHVGHLLESSGKRVRTLYIGGGTPTTLSTQQLGRLMDVIHQHLDLRDCLEFTVEGGRPDTLTPEKLQLLRQKGADRISINPQTMEAAVLQACARPHSPQAVEEAYRWAVDAGFTAINMDLIAGLPQDSWEGFCRSLDAVAALHPSNITVHTLALKKGADLFERKASLPDAAEVAQMVAYSQEKLEALGYRPYYLYRQKYMSGSFENVGWSQPGQDCLYNIYMMEETHTILSLGGGGISKVNLPGGKLQRFPNPKFPEQYLEMLPQVLEDKDRLFALL